jgi:hypothetical protein
MTVRRVWAHEVGDGEKEQTALFMRLPDVETTTIFASYGAPGVQEHLVSVPLVRDASKQNLVGRL